MNSIFSNKTKDENQQIESISTKMSIDSLLCDFSSIDSDILSMDVHPIDKKTFVTSGTDGIVRLYDVRNISSPQDYQNIGKNSVE